MRKFSPSNCPAHVAKNRLSLPDELPLGAAHHLADAHFLESAPGSRNGRIGEIEAGGEQQQYRHENGAPHRRYREALPQVVAPHLRPGTAVSGIHKRLQQVAAGLQPLNILIVQPEVLFVQVSGNRLGRTIAFQLKKGERSEKTPVVGSLFFAINL